MRKLCHYNSYSSTCNFSSLLCKRCLRRTTSRLLWIMTDMYKIKKKMGRWWLCGPYISTTILSDTSIAKRYCNWFSLSDWSVDNHSSMYADVHTCCLGYLSRKSVTMVAVKVKVNIRSYQETENVYVKYVFFNGGSNDSTMLY